MHILKEISFASFLIALLIFVTMFIFKVALPEIWDFVGSLGGHFEVVRAKKRKRRRSSKGSKGGGRKGIS